MILGNFFQHNREIIYNIFRILAGLMFFQHGAQKLFGWFGGNIVDLMSLMWFAGIIEFFGGLLIALGFLSRLIALIAGLEMLYAFFFSHAAQGVFIPILNRGELALMFFSAFLIILIYGSGKFSLENLLFKKDVL